MSLAYTDVWTDALHASRACSHCSFLDFPCLLQLLGLVGSPGKGKQSNFEKVRRGVREICAALRAPIVTPSAQLPSLEERLHHAQVCLTAIPALCCCLQSLCASLQVRFEVEVGMEDGCSV